MSFGSWQQNWNCNLTFPWDPSVWCVIFLLFLSVIYIFSRSFLCKANPKSPLGLVSSSNMGISSFPVLFLGFNWYWKALEFSSKGCVCVCSVAQSPLTLCNPMDYSLPGSSVHGILQARILEWVAISFSRGLSQPRDWTPCLLCLLHCRQIFFYCCTTCEAS